jgi:hypothetical protein
VDDVFIGRMRLSKDWIRGGNDFLTLFKERIMTMTYRRLMIAGLTAAASLTTGLAHAGGATLTFPGGYLNFLHPWPGETPPPGDGGTRDDYAV